MAYSTSDKLAVALACVAGVIAIILFLAEKTPLTVIFLLLFMLALAVYPILHFAKRVGARIVAFSLFGIGTLIFGWYVWPHNHSKSANTQEARQLQEPQQPKPEDKQDDKKGQDQKKPEVKPKPKAEQQPQGPTVGNITQGPCSNVQVGGSNNTATTNCIPPSRVLTAAKIKQLAADYAQIPPLTTSIFPAGTSEDVQPMLVQLCDAMTEASWHPNCQGLNGTSIGGIRIPVIEGMQCFSDHWNTGTQALVKTALDNAGLGCSYINHPFKADGITLGGIVILIGTRVP